MKEFWNFSWHEIGFYDLPAMIDYVLNTTQSSRTFYVGHSQGATVLMVLLTTRTEYNEKIAQAHLMAPPVFMKNMPHPIGKLVASELEVISCLFIPGCLNDIFHRIGFHKRS